MQTPAADLKVFFDHLKALLLKAETEHLQILRDSIDQLRTEFETATRLAAQEALRDAPYFNVFRVLQVSHKEASHSDFLAQLLNPRGEHGQGTLFLSSFLRMIQDRGALQAIKLSSIEQDLQHVTVHREATIIAGRCDVIIQLSSRIFILIEVKVWAAEGDEQLARYSRWLENHRTSFPHRALVFLTPTGRASKTVEASAYIPLSFRPAIHGWLVGCLTQIQPLHVRSVLDEYVADLPGEEGASDGQSSG